jgi:hypothetical protein
VIVMLSFSLIFVTIADLKGKISINIHSFANDLKIEIYFDGI